MNGIVISLGGLRVNYLGCYGAACVETPAIDRFAAENFVFDECFVECPSPAGTRQTWWTGRYRNFRNLDQPAASHTTSPTLIRSLRSAGVRTVLIRDTSALLEGPPADLDAFDQIMDIDRNERDSTGRVFEAANHWLVHESNKGRFLLFVDCHGAHPPWFPPEPSDASGAEPMDSDTSQEIEETIIRSVETDSPEAHESSAPQTTASHERQAYAAIVSSLDSELGSLLLCIRSRAEWEQSLIVITSDCGAELEEDQTARPQQRFLHEGRTHVPLLLRLPGAHDAATRSPALVQPIDLMPTIFDALNVAVPPAISGQSLLPIVRLQARRVRDYALFADAGRALAIRTPAWNLIRPLGGDSASPPETQLFIKPDDRCDRNDVAKQFSKVAEELERVLRRHLVQP